MNRKRSTASLGFPSLVLLGIAVVIVSSGGIGYVIMKNRQISARSRMVEIQRQMQEHQVSIDLNETKIRNTLSIFALKEELENITPSLIEIDPASIEFYREPDEQTLPVNSVARR